MSPADVAERIESFMRDAFHIAPDDQNFTHSVDLYDRGYVDSVGVAETLAFLTDEFDVELEEEDLFSDDFTTIAGMAAIVSRRMARSEDPVAP